LPLQGEASATDAPALCQRESFAGRVPWRLPGDNARQPDPHAGAVDSVWFFSPHPVQPIGKDATKRPPTVPLALAGRTCRPTFPCLAACPNDASASVLAACAARRGPAATRRYASALATDLRWRCDWVVAPLSAYRANAPPWVAGGAGSPVSRGCLPRGHRAPCPLQPTAFRFEQASSEFSVVWEQSSLHEEEPMGKEVRCAAAAFFDGDSRSR
jgi:hypothetical protein